MPRDPCGSAAAHPARAAHFSDPAAGGTMEWRWSTLPLLYDSSTKGYAPMSSSVPPAFPPQNSFPNQPPLPPGKKPNILIWILGGIVVLMLGVTAMCGVAGYFV